MARNVALIVLDTVRQDYFADHASRLVAMSDVTFTQCRAASSCSVPSHASILTGELPHQHGIDSTAVDYSKLTEESTFFSELEAHRTIGVSTNTFAGTPFGFDELFDEFEDVSWTRRFPSGMDAREFVSTTDANGAAFFIEFLRTAVRHEHTLATLSNAALARLDVAFSKLPVPKLLDDGSRAALKTARQRIEHGSEPFFLFTNLMEAHTPHQPTRGYDSSLYDVPRSWNSMEDMNQWEINRNGIAGHEAALDCFRQLYAAAVEYLDRQVSTFVETVQAATDLETTFVITSDHGENLGYEADDTMVGHTSSLSEGLLHVPLILINPPQGYKSVERGYVSHLELGSLIGGLAEGRTPDVFNDRIAAERITTTNTPDTDAEETRYWKRLLRAGYEDEQKWVWDSLGRCLAYDLDFDHPNWQQELDSDDVSIPSWQDEFFSENIEASARRDGSTLDASVDDATRARLEELGYL